MRQLKSGQHFGATKKTLQLKGTILTEAGYIPHIEVPWHYHENAYFFYHLRGHLDEVNKKKTLTCSSGTLLFHHWQDPHYDKNFSTDASFFHIELESNWFLRHQINPAAIEGSMEFESPILKSIIQRIFKESKINDNITQLSVDGLLLQSFAEIIRYSEREKSGLPGWVKKIREILNDTLQEKITLQQLSLETGLHPVHLSKEFPKYFHAGFGEYIRNKKIERATALLSDRNLSISEIAYQCGYADQSHFIRCFKTIHRITPLKFRNRVLGR
jgi:AraC family transcriptional regulator